MDLNWGCGFFYLPLHCQSKSFFIPPTTSLNLLLFTPPLPVEFVYYLPLPSPTSLNLLLFIPPLPVYYIFYYEFTPPLPV